MQPWIQYGLPFVSALLGACGAYLGIRHTARGNDRATQQRELAARREEWWRRFVWAAELSLDDSAVKRVVGLKLLAKLSQSDLAARDEALLLDVFQGRVLDQLLDELRGAGRKEGSA